MQFELQPTLRGTIITVRPLLAADYEELFSAASDPLIWEQHPEPRRYQETVFKMFFQGALESGGAFAVVKNENQQIIGSSRYFGYNPYKSEIEIGWTFLARRYWGGEYNGELKRLMLEHAYRFVEYVIFKVGPNNIRSQKAVLKLGALRSGEILDGSGRESYCYRLKAEQYHAKIKQKCENKLTGQRLH